MPRSGAEERTRVRSFGAGLVAATGGRQRIDKWLWVARVVRTRAAAAELTAAGYVRLNGQRIVAASRPVRAGDVVTVALDRGVRILRVAGFAERRGNAAQARLLYEDLAVASGSPAPVAGADGSG